MCNDDWCVGPEGYEVRIEELKEAVRIAIQFVDVATDWNLNEVEIDGEMTASIVVSDKLRKALK